MTTYLYSIMEQLGISVKELAEKSGVSEMSIRGFRTGRRVPKPNTAFYICEALGRSFNETFGDVMPDPPWYGYRISQMELRMRECGISVEELAEKTGLSRQTILKYKNDPFVGLDPEATKAIQKVLKCSGDKLWGPDVRLS